MSDGAILYLRRPKYPASPLVSHRSLTKQDLTIPTSFSNQITSYSVMADEESIFKTLLKELSQTRYACSELTKLNGGTANFLYRGNLLKPLDTQDGVAGEGTKTVVVKHSEGFSPGNRNFLLDVTRCVMISSTPLGRISTGSDLSYSLLDF